MVSISDLVVRQLDRMRFLHVPFQKNLVNYSAVARLITPAIESELKQSVKQPAVLAAIQRYAEALQGSGNAVAGLVNETIRDCEIYLKTDFFAAYFRRGNDVLLENLYGILKNVNWNDDERFYITERTQEISVCGSSNFNGVISKLGRAEKFFVIENNLALLTIRFPSSCHKVPGLLYYFTSLLEQMNANVFQVFSTYEMVSFVVSETDAPRVLESFNRAIQQESNYAGPVN